jgi:hypothetical protein
MSICVAAGGKSCSPLVLKGDETLQRAEQYVGGGRGEVSGRSRQPQVEVPDLDFNENELPKRVAKSNGSCRRPLRLSCFTIATAR